MLKSFAFALASAHALKIGSPSPPANLASNIASTSLAPYTPDRCVTLTRVSVRSGKRAKLEQRKLASPRALVELARRLQLPCNLEGADFSPSLPLVRNICSGTTG